MIIINIAHSYENVNIKKFYHTQEKRGANLLKFPIKCVHNAAWFGKAWYFWFYESHAIMWGNRAKTKTGYYNVYTSDIDISDIIDTVFNQDHYEAWLKAIEIIRDNFVKKTGVKPTLRQMNDYLTNRGLYKNVSGLLFQDFSENSEDLLSDKFQFRKRIQLAVYNQGIITNFALHYEGQCV